MHRRQVDVLAAGGGATLGGLRQGLSAIARLAAFSRWRSRPALGEARRHHLLDEFAVRGRRVIIDEHESKRMLMDYGVPVTRERLVAALPEAQGAAAAIGFPVVLKAVSDRVAHKSELGLVRLDITDLEALERDWHDLAQAVSGAGLGSFGVLVQEMVMDGVEALVGVSRDRDFGLTLALGPGGVAADLSEVDDVALRVLPLKVGDAADMVSESSRLARLLAGFRGNPPADVAALVACIEALAGFAWAERDYIDEIDLNPVVVLSEGRGCVAADALIVTRDREASQEESHAR